MNIVVCLHAASRGAPAILGRNDGDALALALALGEGHQVTALLAGTLAEAGPLKEAVAAGVTRAVRLVGESSSSADFHTLGQALANAVRKLGADLVLAGARSDDDGLGAVSASMGRHLGWVHVACIEGLDLLQDKAAAAALAVAVTVRGGGRRRRLRVPLPAVVSVAAAPATSSLTAVRRARDPLPTIETLSLADPEATVVRRRTELLGNPEPPQRTSITVSSAVELMATLTRR